MNKNKKKSHLTRIIIFIIAFAFAPCFAAKANKSLLQTQPPLVQAQAPLVRSIQTRKQFPLYPAGTAEQTIAKLLNWVPSENPFNLCRGYYKEPQLLVENPTPLGVKELPTTITSEGPSVFSEKGWSLLQQQVIISQPGRLITADKAYIYRNGTKITRILLVGNVHLEEHGKLMVTQIANWDIEKQTLTFNQVVYHLAESTLKSLALNKKFRYDAWGVASIARRESTGIVQLWNATYTTCSPLNPSWKIQASYINLDQAQGRGTARNVLLKFKNLPIFYSPYFSFPLDKRRKSGFLGVTASISEQNGFDVSVPFYWNIAPNYDLTLTPRLMTTRGVQFKETFRYLTEHNLGFIHATFLPNDQQFQQYIHQTLDDFPYPQPPLKPYIDALRHMNNNRGYFSMNNIARYSPEWSSNLLLNYVTDPYYFRDFGTHYASINANQLLNQLDIRYSGVHWDVVGLIQAYQTLHLIDQIQNPVINQYARLPEFDFNGDYPELPLGLDLQLNGQAVNFDYQSDFPPFTKDRPIGQRAHLRPSISRPFQWSSGYITPYIALDNTDYEAELATFHKDEPRPSFSASRNLPIVNIDSGLFFDRGFNLFNQNYIQTLEPRLFYLYVPFLNQDKYPIFDTQLEPFSADYLFSLNRFVSFDRLQNANQMSFALTSRVLSGDNAEQKFKSTLGFIYYFDPPQVTFKDDKCLPSTHISPLVGQMAYYPTPNWAASVNSAWDVSNTRMANSQLSLTYKGDDSQHIASIGYLYVPDTRQRVLQSEKLNNTNLINVGLAWPLTEKWSTLGYWYYNINRGRPESYYAGLEYSTCCFAIRFIVNQNLLGNQPVTGRTLTNQYKTTYYVQLMLKGLGNFGTNDPSDLLTSTLPGFMDPFGSGNK